MSVFVASTVKYWRIELIHQSSMYASVQVFVTRWCIDKLLSSVTPRFLARSEKSTSLSPIPIDWGISPEVDVLLDIRSIASVFPLFSCNLFKVIQDLTSETHSCIAEMVGSSWSRELKFCICAYNSILSIQACVFKNVNKEICLFFSVPMTFICAVSKWMFPSS